MLDLTAIFQPDRPALMPFIVAGHPDLPTSARLLDALVAGGADVIELGIPYADPLADGPVIQAAANKALAAGANLTAVFKLARDFTQRQTVPLVLFTYYNPVFRFGMAKFVAQATASGVHGLIVPDLPIEESAGLQQLCTDAGLSLVYLVAPTSSPDRQRKITATADSFVYVVSSTGVTGERGQIANQLSDQLATLKTMTKQPLAVGFGISTPEQAKQVADWGADGIVVGSAFVRLIEEAGPEAVVALTQRVQAFRKILG
ncbi:MAG: tryptophan synthase subunit alpha [Candidatus Sericytochromatia bacterium]|nr:tryptophan synthase subunit alpha [Candidatus Sericytochromatia bacterium]